MNIYFAPLQGYTDAAYRRFHDEVYDGCIDAYYTPFMRVEKGKVRVKDLRDINYQYNIQEKIIPQIIVKNIDEFRILVPSIVNEGYREIDLNVGCPFPLQVNKGRGAGLILNRDSAFEIFKEISTLKDVVFSLKMRLGVTENNQWKLLREVINDTPFKHVTLHPRCAKQQYKGCLDIDSFSIFCEEINHDIIYNGDVTEIEQIDLITHKFPQIHGIMIGRGLMARPSMACEYKHKIRLTHKQQLEKFIQLHNKLFQFYSSNLNGETHLLIKMKSFWDYSESLLGHKHYKSIKKATSMSKYINAISELM